MNVLKGICYVLGTIGLMVMALCQFVGTVAIVNTAIIVEQGPDASDLFAKFSNNKKN